jgi:hypothetical protein
MNLRLLMTSNTSSTIGGIKSSCVSCFHESSSSAYSEFIHTIYHLKKKVG